MPDREDHPGTLVVPMGNYVSGRVGNYVIVKALQVGNSVIADNAGLVARALGARTVFFGDSRPEIREHAERLGLTPLEPREVRARPPAPLVVDVSAHPRGLWLALSKTAPDGVCSSAGTLHPVSRIPAGMMYGRNVTFHISRTHVRTLIPPVLALMAEGRLRPDHVTTGR